MNTEIPKVSILMPVYNALPYLEECLESILAQSFADWELIAINDFSTDDSGDVLKEYAQKDQRITVLTNKEKGIIPALNMAYHHAQSLAITRMDADDIMPPEKLEMMYDSLLQHPRSCITGKVKYIASGKMVNDGYKKYESWLNELVDHGTHYEHIYKECVVPSPCWMMHKDTLDSIHGITSDRYPEDYDLVFRMYYNDVKIIGISKILHIWRDHDRRASRNDDHYKDQRFLTLKIHHFINTDYHGDIPLMIWGSGKEGKRLAKELLKKNIPFRWITGNKNKIGHNIYDIILEPEEVLHEVKYCQIITAIKQRGFKEYFKEKFSKTLEHMSFYHFY